MPPEVRVGYELSASLRQQGITESTDIEVFWELCSQRMSSEEDKTACRAIGAELKVKLFALFVESMYDLSRSEILDGLGGYMVGGVHVHVSTSPKKNHTHARHSISFTPYIWRRFSSYHSP